MAYVIEARDITVGSGWSTDTVDGGRGVAYATRELAEAQIPELASSMECSADDLRVVELHPEAAASYTDIVTD